MKTYGYDKFADLVGQYPENAIYRKFAALGAKNLHYKQAEISLLQRELALISEYDQSHDPNQAYAKSWERLSQAPDENGANLQMKKAQALSEKLDRYYESILRTRTIFSLTGPRKSELDYLRYWLDSDLGGDCFLQGIEREPYADKHTDDLLTLSPTAGTDPFAQLLSDKIVPLYHRHIGHRCEASSNDNLGPLWEYKHQLFERIADVMCAILSSMIPVTSIFLLYFVHSMLRKLIIATAMNFLFSFIVAMVVRGRRADVFAASTAFAAIQVVFIGGVNIILKKQ